MAARFLIEYTMILPATPDSVGIATHLLNPSAHEVRDHLSSLADAFSLPRRFVLASAQTERDFNPDDTHGLPQVSGVHIGRTLRDADGSPFEIEDDIKADWRANARAGVDRLARQYQVAQLENPFGSLEEWAQQAYSGFSAGNPFRDRYLTTLSDDLPAHPRDRVFLRNFRKAASESHQEKKQPQVPNAQQPSAQQPAQNQAPPSTAKLPVPSSAGSLPAPLQRLKENPGNLFMQSPAPSDDKNQPRPTFRDVDLVPSLSNAPLRTRSLGDIASLLSSQQPAPESTSALPGPLQHLTQSPGEIFVPRSGFSVRSEQAIQQAARNGYIHDVDDFKARILQAAAESHVSPNLLVGLAERESSLDPKRVNEIGAKGLFQLLPARQKDLGIVGDDVFDYKVVIPKVAGTLREALDRYQGNIDLALASWPLGDSKLQGHLRQAEQRGQDPIQRIRSLLLYGDNPKGPRLGNDYIDFITKYVVSQE